MLHVLFDQIYQTIPIAILSTQTGIVYVSHPNCKYGLISISVLFRTFLTHKILILVLVNIYIDLLQVRDYHFWFGRI